MRTARAKGLGERQIMIRHVLRNSMIPIITLWGLDFGAVVGGGAILTETVFDLQGVGQYAAESIGQLDVPPVLATTLFASFFIVLLNAIVDIMYAVLDPRIRSAMSTHEAAAPAPGDEPLLAVDDLRVSFATEEGTVQAVDGVCFDLKAGEVLAVVGESGSGKSVTAMTLLGLTRSPERAFKGTATYKGTELIGASEDQLRKVRGAEIAMIFQDPMTRSTR